MLKMSDTDRLLPNEETMALSEESKEDEGIHRGNYNQYHQHQASEAQSRIHPTIINSSELRIVLVGKTGSGKSSSGNTILNRDEFKVINCSANGVTKNCQEKKGMVGEKNVSVIDTPGVFDPSITEETLRSEIENGVYLSAPGPHVFLVVIRLDVKFTEEEKKAVEKIQKNFGKDTARYTIILFTHAEELKGNSSSKYTSDNRDLQAFVDNCGGRCHSFSNKDKTNRSQVTQLLEKIEEMVKKNGGDHYTNEMFQKAQRKIQIQMFWSQTPRIVLLGKTGSGKTATIKNILENPSPNSPTKTCEEHSSKVDGNKVKIMDTPGLFETSKNMVNAEIKKLFCMSDPAAHVLLLVIKLDGKSTEKNTLKWFQENFGEDAVKHTIILFTHEDQLKGKTLNEHIRLKSEQRELTDSCGTRYHSFSNKDMKNRSQVTQLLEKIRNMVEENGGDHYTNEMFQEAQRKTNEMFQEAQRKITMRMFWSLKPSIVLLGKSGSGKTALRRNILRENCNSPISATKTCEEHEANVDGKHIGIIDTPGHFETTEKRRSEIENCVDLSYPGAHAFLLVIKVDERITDEKKTLVQWIPENIREEAAPYTIILFTHADQLRGETVEECITERSDLQALVNRCDGRYFSFNNADRENQHQVTELLQKIETLAERNKWKYFSNDNFIEFMKNKKHFERFKAALGGIGGAGGIAGVIAGGVLLGVAEIVIAPAVAVGVGVVAIGAAGVYTYKKITQLSRKSAWDSFINSQTGPLPDSKLRGTNL